MDNRKIEELKSCKSKNYIGFRSCDLKLNLIDSEASDIFLIRNISDVSPSEKLRRIIARCSLSELKEIHLCDLSEKEISNEVSRISSLVYNQIRSQYCHESIEYLKNLILCIIWFLTKVKLLNETDQLINVSNVALETHDEELFTLSTWQTYAWSLIQFLREATGFKIRTKHHNPFSESKRHSIWSYKVLSGLINDRIVSYLDIDYKTEIKIHYNDKCQGIDDYCVFDIDYKLLPALSFDHLLENYSKIVNRVGYEYIRPKQLLQYSLDKAIIKMQTQIGGLKLVCKNCHYTAHHKRYRFPPIFKFLKSLSLKFVNENPSEVLKIAEELAIDYLKQNRGQFKISETNPIPTIKYNIKISILKLVNKKYCIEFLFGENYVCPICQKANINDHLDLFVAHHTNSDLIQNTGKIEFSSKFDRKPIDWLIEKLIVQECIFICHNCHTIDLATNYRDSVLPILNDANDAQYVKKFYENLDKKIDMLKNIILTWKDQLLNNNLAIPNPFPKKQLSIFERGEAMEKRLVCIYYVCDVFSKYTEKRFFMGTELSYILNRNESDFYDFKNRLITLGFIQYKERLTKWKDIRINKDIYQITNNGIRKAIEIIKLKRKNFSNEFDKLVSNWLIKYEEYFQNFINA
jgi:hypothetical protein